MFVYIVKVLIL